MVKKTTSQRNAKKGKKDRFDLGKRDLVLRMEEQEYGQIVQIMGDRRFKVYCFDGKTRIAHVPGKFKRRIFFLRDDIILVQLRDYQDDKADILHRYTPEEILILKQKGEIPSKAGLSSADLLDPEEGDQVEFDSNLDLL